MFILWILLAISSVMAHTTNKTNSGQELFWSSRSLNIKIFNGSKSLSSGQANSLLQSSITQWNNQSSGKVSISSSSYNNLKFTQNSDIFGPGVVGVTQVTSNAAGVISQADIILNEKNYTFTTSPTDSGSSVYLGDVLTHELGHFMGLSHSEVIESSMFYSSFRGQSTLSEDDKSGIRAKYDGSTQIIQGRVAGGKNIGVFGAHVMAFSASDASVQSSTITNENGSFRLTGLEADQTYYLYITTLKNGSSIESGYQSVQSNFCPGSYVGSFFSGCSENEQGIPQPIHLSYGETEDVGTMTIRCNTNVPIDYYAGKIASPKQNYSVFEANQQAMVGVITNSEVPLATYQKVDEIIADYRGLSVSGMSSPFLKIGLNVTQLGSPLDFHMVVTRDDGAITYIPQEPTRFYVRNLVNPDNLPNFDPLTMIPSFDHQKKISLSSTTASNRFKIEVYARKARSLDQLLTFPVIEGFVSTKDWPYLLTLNVGAVSGMSDQFLITDTASQDNLSCLDAPFTYAIKKSQAGSASTASSKKDEGSGASCGTISLPPTDGGPGGGMMGTIFVGFILAGMASIIQKSRKYFL